jgi:hypothetical protein
MDEEAGTRAQTYAGGAPSWAHHCLAKLVKERALPALIHPLTLQRCHRYSSNQSQPHERTLCLCKERGLRLRAGWWDPRELLLLLPLPLRLKPTHCHPLPSTLLL